MKTVSVEQLRARLAMLARRRAHFEWKSENTEQRLARHEAWRHQYTADPYLLGAPDERLAERFRDIFVNQTELGRNSLIGVLPFEHDDTFPRRFTHLLEEYGARGGLPDHVAAEARKPVLRYFENGGPIATQIFDGYVEPSTPFLVKYGRREFLEPMLREGRIRICPASYYNDKGHADAVRDDETSRIFCIPTFRDRLKGVSHLDFDGHRIDFGDDDLVLPLVMPDYFLFSLCDHIYYRLPTDFEADAALIIRDPSRFVQRVISAFLARRPDWDPQYGAVTYYDPYNDYEKLRDPEMAKHFRYSYQRESRIVLRPKRRIMTKLAPEFLTIGPIDDFAELAPK